MNDAEAQRIRELLLALREDALARSGRLEAALSELIGSRVDSNDDDEHDPEGVTLSAEWSRLSGLATQASQELEEVEAAFTRLERGTYGVCTTCGAKIPVERLEVRPFAEHCVPCASGRRSRYAT